MAGNGPSVQVETVQVETPPTAFGREWQRVWALLFGLLAPFFVIFVIALLVELWPVVTSDSMAARNVDVLWMEWNLDPQQAFLVAASLGGVLGGLLYTMGSYARGRGSARFSHAWSNWYWSRSIIGGGLGLAVYLLVRGGLLILGGSDEGDSLPNPYAIVAIAVITGLFTDVVMGKLREISNQFFGSEDEDSHTVVVVNGPTEPELAGVGGAEPELARFGGAEPELAGVGGAEPELAGVDGAEPVIEQDEPERA